MKRVAIFLILFFVAGAFCARAQPSADGQYLSLYGLIQEADALAGSGDLRQALADYTSVQAQLQQFQYAFPEWNPKIITFRLKYLAGKITDLTTQLKSIPSAPTGATHSVLNDSATNGSSASVTSAEDGELSAMRRQLAAAQSENAALLAKLKEALSVQPAVPDAGALARAQEQIRSLMKENDLLKAGAMTGHAAIVAGTNAQSVWPGELTQARQQIAALQSEAQVRQLENAALENRLRLWQTNAPVSNEKDNEARIRELTRERDDLLAQLGEANKRLHGYNKAAIEVQMDLLNDQIRTLRERLAVAEAQPSPYTPDELALLKPAVPELTTAEVQKKSVKQLPAGSAGLVAEAQGFFSAKQYDRAEADYLKILEQDPNNSLVLGNLATIEMQEGKLEDAEKHIKAALVQDPNDAFNLSALGHLKFQQGKYDEALDVLSRAAKLDPQNPEIQNYLGVTLGNKGLRLQAEAALRRAIELNPNYADAQKNLAAIYISATPPLVGLARWHYQKALEDGQPHDPGLEKALAEKSGPVVP